MWEIDNAANHRWPGWKKLLLVKSTSVIAASTTSAPGDRDIAMVFLNYALYPHMTVRQNLAFGLKMRKTPKHEIDKRVEEVASILGMQELLHRRPKELSGGQTTTCRGRPPRLFENPKSSCSTNLFPTSTQSFAFQTRSRNRKLAPSFKNNDGLRKHTIKSKQ